jgi:TPR repeat protein
LISKLEEVDAEVAIRVVEQWVLELVQKRSVGALNRLGRDVYKMAGKLHSRKGYLFAFELFAQAARMGSIAAENNVALCLETGNGVEKDEKRAAALYRKNVEKDPWAMVRFARCLQHGIGVGRDEELAVVLYREVAKSSQTTAKNSADAKYRLGSCLLKGIGGKRDEKEGFFWISQAAALGLREAMHALAQCYISGFGVAQDKAQALGWLLMCGFTKPDAM